MKIKKALTLRASSIGDCLMAKYFLENIHVQYPEARCGILIGQKEKMIKELFLAYPWLEIIEANRKNLLSLIKAFIRFFRSDLTVTQYSENKFSAPSKLFARLITKRGGLIGFEDGWRFNHLIYNRLLSYTGETEKKAIFFYEQEALKAAGLNVTVKKMNLDFHKNESILKRLGLKEKQYILVHLFSGNEGRGLTYEKRKEFLDLLNKYLGKKITIVCTGSAAEAAEIDKLIIGTEIINIAGKTNIQELINLIYFSRIVVSVDTGVAHIAAHLENPLVVLTRCESYYSWWSKDQYPQKNIKIFSNLDVCKDGHKITDFPICLNTIDFNAVADFVLKEISD